jgi:hypothetical protein
VDANGSAYVTGFTRSADFPSLASTQLGARGRRDGFVARVGASGSALTFATVLGGFGDDEGIDVAIGAGGKVHVLGHTTSTDLPAARSARPAGTGAWDLFVARIDASGPVIAGAVFSRKKLIVRGEGYDAGAVILVNGSPLVTRNDRKAPAGALIGKKAARVIAVGETVTLRVRNSSGALSNEYRYTRR